MVKFQEGQMPLGYSLPLFALPCDQRTPLVAGLFGWHGPLTDDRQAQVAAVKAALYAGLRRAAAATQAHRSALVTIDPERGADIFRHATAHGFHTAVTIDPPGGDASDLEPGVALRVLEELPAPFVKARVVDDCGGARHARTVTQLGRLMVPLRARNRRLIVELRAGAALGTLRAIQRLQDDGVEPDVWILDPLDAEVTRLATAIARRDGRDRVGCLVQLGGDDMRARRDVATAASVAGFIGFGVDPALLRTDVESWRTGAVSWEELVALVAGRYRSFIDAFGPGARAVSSERLAATRLERCAP